MNRCGQINTVELPDDLPALVARLVDDAAGRRLVVLLDGGSGSGKTTLATTLAARLGAHVGPVQLLSLDDVYPGWSGLAAASRAVPETILRPTSPGYRRWSWDAGTPADWRPLDPSAPILVEGCGALSRASAPLASTRLWFQRDAAQRKELALSRADGDGFRPWWDHWCAQEQHHWDANRPWELADFWVLAAGMGS